MQLVRLEGLEDLRGDALRWDDLWRRSETTLPTARAELLALWVEQFAPRERFVALAVENQGALIAALPVVSAGGAKGRLLGQLPGNCWAAAGDLLLDPSSAVDDAVRLLATGLAKLPWPVILAEGVDAQSGRWQAFWTALRERGLCWAARPQFPVGLIDVGNDWESYEAAWSGNHRRAVRKSLRKLQTEGAAELKRYGDLSPDDASRLLRTLCEIEDKSWKGDEGTSILRTPGMWEFFDRHVRRLAGWGQVELLFLELGGRPIAGDFGYVAKGVYHSHKIAYDPEFRHAGPGQVLRSLQLRKYFEDADYRLVDTLGILSEANAKWATRSYMVSRVLFSAHRLFGNPLVSAYEQMWPRMKRLLRRENSVVAAEAPGAANYLNSRKQEEGTGLGERLAAKETAVAGVPP